MHRDVERVLFAEERIRTAIGEVAERITARYRGADLTVVGVLKGSCIFVADLIRALPIPLELSFVAASSYGAGSRSGTLQLSLLPDEAEVAGRHLLLVDDILDTGRTLSSIRAECVGRGAASVETCVFLDKPARREVPFDADFRCFEVEDVFVVGYGLDFAGRYRNLPYVAALRPEIVGR